MIRISLLNDLVQFTLPNDLVEREKEKKYLKNALSERSIDYSNIVGNTVSDCDIYVHISQFQSVNDIRDLFIPDLLVKDHKNVKFFQEPPQHYQFNIQNNDISADQLIGQRISELNQLNQQLK